MIHVTRSFRPEVVLFGHDQKFTPPLILDAGKSIMINASANADKVTVSKFAVGVPDQKRVVSLAIDDVIRAVVELGGTYPDVVQALQQAKVSGALPGRFEVDALPDIGREYVPKSVEVAEGETTDAAAGEGEVATPADSGRIEVANPLPELFGRGSRVK